MAPRSIDKDEVRRLIADEDAQLVEVLPAKEYGEEHIVGAINIPLKELDERAPRRAGARAREVHKLVTRLRIRTCRR
jgi:rhodanese-related sulfurtransferase